MATSKLHTRYLELVMVLVEAWDLVDDSLAEDLEVPL